MRCTPIGSVGLHMWVCMYVCVFTSVCIKQYSIGGVLTNGMAPLGKLGVLGEEDMDDCTHETRYSIYVDANTNVYADM